VSSAGGSTADTVLTPHFRTVQSVVATYRSTAPIFGAAWTSLGHIGVEVTTAGGPSSNAFGIIIRRSSDGLALPVHLRLVGK
jgi:hypothetical protein